MARINNFLFAVIAAILNISVSFVNAQVDSKEFKAMLKPADFVGSTSQVTTKLAQLKTALVAAAQGTSSSGSFALKSGMPRTVKFYDTTTCDIRNKGYTFRMRRESGKSNWEGTLKYRNITQSEMAKRQANMDTCSTSNLGNKIELDIGLDGDKQYAFSQDCQISNKKVIDVIDDVEDTWPEIDNVWVAEFGWSLTKSIVQVGSLTITERVYDGYNINFPGTVAKFDVALWYNTTTSTTPVLAELSFKTDGDNDSNVDTFFAALPTKLSAWLDTTAPYKTTWLYTKSGC